MSNAEEIKTYYRQLLADGKAHSRQELFSYVKENDKDNKYNEAMMQGALKTLVDKERDYIVSTRGYYQFVDSSKQGIEFPYVEILKTC